MKKNTFKLDISRIKTRGFILPFTMLITVIVLFITTSSMSLLSKQLYFSKIYKQSQTAYYAADDAISCAIVVDDTYLSGDGLGIFPSSTTTEPMTYIDDVITYTNARRISNGLPTITLNEIECAQSAIFDASISNFAVASTTYRYVSQTNGVEEGRTSTYRMRMDLGGGLTRCARVTINKTQSFRQIIAQGYAQCDSQVNGVERAVINTTIVE